MDAVPIVPPLFRGTKNTTLHELQTGDRSRATDSERCKLLKIAGLNDNLLLDGRRSAVRARMPEASSPGLNCRHDPLGHASRPDLMRLLRLSPVRMQGLIVMLQLGTPAAASAASAW